ncbi:MAG: TetR/AcrR family transcriptional regulator [Alphaproteobacteria bacterium]|nr:TetR/AcrR family transcriptional regulator [Alphaproteobacteria bacterium]
MQIQSYADVLAALQRFTDQDAPDSAQARKRRRIVATAAALFERHGYRKASISAVAREAAIAKGTVYLYFPSKAHLLLHVLMWERAELYRRMAPALEGKADPKERLRALLTQAVLHAEAMPISNLLKQGDPELRAALSEVDLSELRASLALFAQIFRWLVGSTSPALPAAELDARAHLLMATLQAVPALLRARGAMPLEAFAAGFADMLLEGVTRAP